MTVIFSNFGNFWRTLEMSLISYEISLDLTSSGNCAIWGADRATTSATTDTKLYIPAVTWATLNNPQLLQQLKPGFKQAINWKKYQSKV